MELLKALSWIDGRTIIIAFIVVTAVTLYVNNLRRNR